MKKRIILLLCFLAALAVLSLAAAESAPSLSLGESPVVLSKGKTVKLNPAAENVENPKKLKYTWESSDESVVTVANGSLRAVDGGRAAVTCSAELPDGTVLKAAVDVEVTVPVAALKLTSPNLMTIGVGRTAKAEYELTPANASDPSLEWTSSDEAVATVDGEGNVTAVAPGSARITAETKDGSRKKLQAGVYVPSLWCGADSVSVDKIEGASVEVEYYGSSWDEDVTLTPKGNLFSCSSAGGDGRYTVQIKGLTPGSGTLTINSKKDPKSRIELKVTVAGTAIEPYRYVLFTNASCGKNGIRFSYKNNTGTDIYNCIFAVIPYNKDGEQIYYTKTPGEEPCYYYTQKTLKEGAVNKFTGSVEYDGEARYEEVDHIDVALDYIRLSDGTEITLPDAAHYWYSSQTQSYLEEPEGAGSNTRPEDSVLEKAGSIRLGYTSTLLRRWMKEHYGFSHGGEYILEVSQGSIAEKAGLCAGDLIFSVDGLDAGTDNFCTEKGKAKIADGQSVVFTVERSGQESPVDLALTK